MVAILVTSLSFGQELLTNGNLESWDDATTPTGWTKAEVLDQESTDIHGGTYAAKRDGTVNPGTKDLAQTVTVTGGDNYTVTLWYKVVSGDDTDARIWASWKDAAGDYLPNDQQSPELKGPNNAYLPNNGNVWTEYTATINAPADAATLNFEVRAYGASVVIWDDLSFFHNATALPGLSITAPSNGDTLPSGDVTVSFTATNFDIGAADGTHDGHIHCVVDGDTTNPIMKFDNTPFVLTGLADGQHTAYLELVDDSHAPISPAVNQTVTFTLSSFTQVADIAALRAGAQGGFYELTGEAFINYAQSYRGQKYIQDATAGILIDDTAGNITAGMRGDGLSGIKGTLGEYKGMLQFIPTMDATVVSPSTLTITPQVITLADLTTNFEDYEAELVTVENVMIDNTPDVNYVNNTVYPMTSGGDSFNFRTNYGADYIGTAVPTVAVDVTGFPIEKTGAGSSDFGQVLMARDAADIVVHTASVEENTIKGFNMYPNPTKNVLNITTAQNLTKNVQIFDILGKQVVNTNLNGTTLNVANLNAGLYLIKVQEAGNSVTRKLVIK